MATLGGDPFLGLLAGGISFDKKRFARDISLFKPQARVPAVCRCIISCVSVPHSAGADCRLR